MISLLNDAFKSIHKQYYDDLVDRMNYYYSTMILLCLALVVSAKQYFGNPIDCWFPGDFQLDWILYAENYCFISNTYYVPLDQHIGSMLSPLHRSQKINYYQWVPMMLALQSLMFYLPNLIWKILNLQSGVNVKSILKMASNADISDDEEKRKIILTTLAKYIEDAMSLQSKLGGVNLFCFRYGRVKTYLTSLYMFTKFLYILNVVGQFMILHSFFGTNYTVWGFQTVWDVIRGNEWTDSGNFPRVTLCDFTRREIDQNMNYTVPCILLINMFTEKIFVFLWVWLCFVGFWSVVNFIYWIFTLLSPCYRYRYVHKYLRIGAEMTNSPNDRKLVEEFVRKALRSDGVLLMRFISGHAGDILFQEWHDKIKQRKSEKEKLPLNCFRSASVAASKQSTYCACCQNGFNETLYDVDRKM